MIKECNQSIQQEHMDIEQAKTQYVKEKALNATVS